MRTTAVFLATRLLLTLVLFIEVLLYTYIIFGRLLHASSADDDVQTPRPLFYYCCTALAGTALATAISVSCCCLDRSGSERAVNGLVYSFLAALCVLALSQLAALIVLFCFADYRSVPRFLTILALLLLSTAAIGLVVLQHHFTIRRIRGYGTVSSSSSGRGGGATAAVPTGTASPPTNGVYEQLKQPDPEEYARLKDAANGGGQRAHNQNMFDYYGLPEDKCCKPAPELERSVEV